MSIKNILRKAASLVVELPPEPVADLTAEPLKFKTNLDDLPAEPAPRSAPAATKSVEQIIKETPGPNLDQIKIAEETAITPSPAAPDGKVDYQTVYQRAGLTPVAFSAEQALEVIRSLPNTLPIEVRRATVNATIAAMGKAMGVDTAGVIADAGRKVAALSAYEDLLTHQTSTYVGTLEMKILELETQIAMHREEIQKTQALLSTAVGQCDAESNRLDEVLEFFTLDTGASSNAPA